jgi:FixJ family two-component response regulator
MPEMDGFELRRRIAGTDHDLPFVVITGDGDEETRDRSLKAGAVSFFQKPFDDEEILQAIYRALNREATSSG